MRNGKVRIVIGLMGLSLVGLIFIQVYWISKAVSVNRAIFERHVNDALQNVALKLERRDAFVFVSSTTQKDTSILPDIGVKSLGRGTLRPYLMNDLQRMKQRSKSVTDISESEVDQLLASPDADSMQLLTFEENIIPDDLLQKDAVTSKEELNKVLKKKYLLQKLAVDMVQRNNPIEARVDTALLNEMLAQELVNQNITIPYEYGVFQEHRNRMVFVSQEAQQDKLASTVYKAQLFPNDFFLEPNFLKVYFPKQNSYLLQQVGVILTSSFVFILIIFLTFMWMMRSFLEQKKLSEMKTDFINNMTHEFKTPITTIALASEAIKDPEVLKNDTRLNRLAGVISEENKRLEKQVERVLQMARHDRGELKIVSEPVNMHAALQEAVSQVGLMIEERKGKVNLNLSALKTDVTADKVHLANIIHNLLDNAIKYSSGHPEITISTTNEKGSIRIDITDKGIGMANDEQSRIFEKFYRVPTGNVHNVKGFGLGLSYVKTMLEAHGGTISVKSSPGKGSTFSIFFPLNSITEQTLKTA
jgi:two-component system, OmpR family, phosphate regulon sensor histidine kinase PhoR